MESLLGILGEVGRSMASVNSEFSDGVGGVVLESGETSKLVIRYGVLGSGIWFIRQQWRALRSNKARYPLGIHFR